MTFRDFYKVTRLDDIDTIKLYDYFDDKLFKICLVQYNPKCFIFDNDILHNIEAWKLGWKNKNSSIYNFEEVYSELMNSEIYSVSYELKTYVENERGQINYNTRLIAHIHFK